MAYNERATLNAKRKSAWRKLRLALSIHSTRKWSKTPCAPSQIDSSLHQPQQALIDYAKAEEAGSRFWQGRQDLDPELFAQIAEGRAVAYFALGERQRAIDSQQEAIRKAPNTASHWDMLANLCERDGRMQLAEQARQQASALSK